MKRLPIVLFVLFITDFILDSIVAAGNANNLRYLSKGLLMPLLLAFFITATNNYISNSNNKFKRLICFALIFSFLGDVLLIGESSLHFMLGIAAFLIAHIFYIIFFCLIQPFKKKNSSFILINGLIILSYVIMLDYLFWPLITKQNLTIPVITYSLVLGTMLFAAVNVINAEKQPGNFVFLLVGGAILFVASDSMIAFNKFYLAKPLNGFYIMSTYCIAQFLIVLGAIKFIRSNVSSG